MKKIILSMFLLGTVVIANAQVPIYVPSNGLKAWWPFSGNANDASGNGKNGTVNGATLTADRFGNSSSAFQFDGLDDYISVNIDLFKNITVSCWIKAQSTTNKFPTFFDFQLSSANAKWIFYGQAAYNTQVASRYVTLDNSSSPVYSDNVNLNGLSLNSWQLVTVVIDSSINKHKLYINGVLTNENNIQGTKLIADLIEFGRYGKSSNAQNNFYGTIDDIGIWNRALTASEIYNLYIGCQLSISNEPSNQTANINTQTQFNVLVNDTTASYQWQSNSSSMGWANVPSNSVYSGVTSKKFTVNNIQVNNHKQLFRVIATKNTCKDTSVVAMLTVNDTCITSTRDTLYIKVNTSSLSNPVYNTVKVYPNPSSTQVIIDNGNYSTMGTYSAKILNAAGQQVFQSVINQQQFVVDAKTMGGAGVYTLYITDANNKVVGVKKIVLQ